MFVVHALRSVSSLSGLWDFAYLGPVDPESFVPSKLTAGEKAFVPSAFDAQPAHAGKRGLAVYQTEVVISEGRAARLEFESVGLWTRVFIDDLAVAENASTYLPFSVEMPASRERHRRVTVLVDNRFDVETRPMHEPFFDFYQYGGILRDVRLHLLPLNGPWIESVQVTPTEDYAKGEVELAIRLSETQSMRAAFIGIQFDDGEMVSLPNLSSKTEIRARMRVPKARLWSPDAPNLHTVRVVLLAAEGAELDDFSARFGLRKIEARDAALWLNGEPLRLLGYNRHEWHPNFGPCTPVAQMAQDLQLLRAMGCNFVRGSHYPQDPRFLDLCDELGVLVWEETLGWQNSLHVVSTPGFRQAQEQALHSMVAASYNHPCVIIRGFLNEVDTAQDCIRPLLELSVSTLKALDPTRLVSYASRLAETDRHFDLVDLISINLYPGWYDCEKADEPLELIKPHIDRCVQSIDRRGFSKKPILVAEMGAEALYGWHDINNDFFTEEYQAEYLRHACRSVLDNERCCGIALWLFSDVRGAGKGRSLSRPRTFNNKGTLDEYRRPKLARNVVRELFIEDRRSHQKQSARAEGGRVSAQ